MDRIARNALVSRTFRDELGTDLVVVSMPMEDSDEGELMGGLGENISEYEKNKITARMYEGRVKKQQTGEHPFNGSTPYWCKRVWAEDGKRKIELLPDRAAVAQRMFAMSAAGDGAGAIARALNADSVPSSTGTQWSSRAVLLVLHSSAAYGEWVCYGPNPQGVAAKLVRRGLERSVGVVHRIPPIIDRVLFDEVQAGIDERTRTRGPNNNWLLACRLQCEACGNFMYIKWNNSKYAMRVYACAKLNFDTVTKCANPYRRIPADELEAQLTTTLSAWLSSPAAIEDAVRIFLRDLDGRVKALVTRSGGDARRFQLEAKLKRLRHAYVEDDAPDEAEYEKRVADVKAQLARLNTDQATINELQGLQAQRSEVGSLLSSGRLRVAVTRAGYAGVMDDEMNVLLRGSTADLLKAFEVKLVLRTTGIVEVTGRLPFELFVDARVKTPKRNGHPSVQAHPSP